MRSSEDSFRESVNVVWEIVFLAGCVAANNSYDKREELVQAIWEGNFYSSMVNTDEPHGDYNSLGRMTSLQKVEAREVSPRTYLCSRKDCVGYKPTYGIYQRASCIRLSCLNNEDSICSNCLRENLVQGKQVHRCVNGWEG